VTGTDISCERHGAEKVLQVSVSLLLKRGKWRLIEVIGWYNYAKKKTSTFNWHRPTNVDT
jgi:hypothetical protein